MGTEKYRKKIIEIHREDRDTHEIYKYIEGQTHTENVQIHRGQRKTENIKIHRV
jgi:hypothetical protein